MENLVIRRRKISVRVRLADSTVLEGALYAPVEMSGGRPGRLVDRLNEPHEKYLPLALEGRHILLSKAGIVLVELKEKEDEVEGTGPRETRELQLQFRFADGTKLRGTTRAEMPPERARVLDYMNTEAPRFITLALDGHVMIVNEAYVIAVSEDPAPR